MASESVAYDLARFDNRRRVQEALAAEPVARAADPARVAMPKSAVKAKAKAKSRISLFAMVSYVALFTLFLFIVMNYMRLNEITIETSRLQSELARLENEEARLKIEYERKTNLREVDARASELGLYSPGADQIVYIDISRPDRAEIYGSDKPEGFIDGVRTLFVAVADFFE